MQCLTEFEKTFSIANGTFDKHTDLINTFIEMVCNNYDQQREEFEVKCVQEHVSDDSLKYLCEEAEKGLGEKLKKAVSKTSDNMSETLSTVKNGINKVNKNLGSTGTLRKLQSKIQDNPFLKKVTVTVPTDTTFNKNGYKELISALNRAVSKNSLSEFTSIEDKFSQIIKNAEKQDVTITVEKLISQLVEKNNSLDSTLDKIKKDMDKTSHGFSNLHAESSEHQKLIAKASLLSSKIYHRMINMEIESFTTSLKELEKAIKKNKNVSESVEDSDIDTMVFNIPDDDFMTEAFNDFKKELEEYSSSKQEKESIKDSDFVLMSESFSDSFMNQELFKDQNTGSEKSNTELDNLIEEMGFTI
ncbi:MAG TPA: hypothetical protein DCW90_09125 [Lachnospiraceae bacterium]|nr:hypothetical protein [Lachnospiraceae bacterium]